MTENEKKIIQLEKEIEELKSVLNDALECGRLMQLSYNKLVFATPGIPASINRQLTQARAECAVLTRRVNHYVDRVNNSRA